MALSSCILGFMAVLALYSMPINRFSCASQGEWSNIRVSPGLTVGMYAVGVMFVPSVVNAAPVDTASVFQ